MIDFPKRMPFWHNPLLFEFRFLEILTGGISLSRDLGNALNSLDGGVS